MGNILINNKKVVKGKLSIVRAIIDNKFVIEGLLQTHRYFEDINSIITDRVEIEGITVYKESYGSDDFELIYEFRATKMDFPEGETHLTQEELDEETIKKYNETEYGEITDEDLKSIEETGQ